MTIKDAFDKAENGTLTFEQFQELAKDAKFADLATGEYVSKRKYEDEIAGKDRQISDLNATIQTRDGDLTTIKKQLEEAGVDKEALAKLNEGMAALQSKYDADMQSYQEKLNKQAYEFAVKEFASSKKFTSNAAKRDFIKSMTEKNLQMEKDTILGAEDFVTAYSAENADAFVVEKKTEDPPKDKPHFVHPTGGQSDPEQGGGTGGFSWNFTGVR